MKKNNKNTATIKPPVEVLKWMSAKGKQAGFLRLLDQTKLPTETTNFDCRTSAQVWDAIKRLVVRGAPAIGVAGAYGMVVAGQEVADGKGFMAGLEKKAKYLESSRPTAVNLSWGVRRVLQRARNEAKFEFDPTCPRGCAGIRAAMLEEARIIQDEDARMCMAIGKFAAPLVKKCKGVLTHCNAGAIATVGIGTATAGMYVAHAAGHKFTAYCDETRPLLQGSRLTAWELQKAGIDTYVICDNMAAQVMREGRVQMVIVGADRITANGDTANKIGTYGVAILAKRHSIPFYVAAPYSTFDLSMPSGDRIPIEQRDSQEIAEGFGRRTAPWKIKTYNPAFDMTPAELITGIITDKGIISPVNAKNVRKAIES